MYKNGLDIKRPAMVYMPENPTNQPTNQQISCTSEMTV